MGYTTDVDGYPAEWYGAPVVSDFDNLIAAVRKARAAMVTQSLPRRLELTQDEFDTLIELVGLNMPLDSSGDRQWSQPSLYGIDLLIREHPNNHDDEWSEKFRALLRREAD